MFRTRHPLHSHSHSPYPTLRTLCRGYRELRVPSATTPKSETNICTAAVIENAPTAHQTATRPGRRGGKKKLVPPLETTNKDLHL